MTPHPALILIQARMGSARLPGKVLAQVGGVPVLERCVRRLQTADVGPVTVATTALADDDPVGELAQDLGAIVVRGPVDDVLQRFVLAAECWTGPFVIRATADNPLVDPGACVRVVERLAHGADYVGEKGLPVGAGVEGMTTMALRVAGREATEPYDREHVTPWLRRAVQRFAIDHPAAPDALARPDLRFTIDTPDDLEYVRSLVAAAGVDPLLPLPRFIEAADRVKGREGA